MKLDVTLKVIQVNPFTWQMKKLSHSMVKWLVQDHRVRSVSDQVLLSLNYNTSTLYSCWEKEQKDEKPTMKS